MTTADHKILITTSGLGSRLGSLTEHTNKSLVKVGDKPSISHILDFYGKHSKFVITIGHHGDKVVQFLDLTYKDWNFEFVKVDKYEGKGSSLGYSMSLCKDVIKTPFIFHACDTIIKEETPPHFQGNWLVGCKSYDYSNYRTLAVDGYKILKVREKGDINPLYCYAGVAGIWDHGLFFALLDRSLSERGEASDADVINAMVDSVEFKLVEVDEENWLDIGNSSSLNSARSKIKKTCEVLEKNEESIFFKDDLVIKFFSDKNIAKNRVTRASMLCDFVPKIIDSRENFYSYKREEGTVFSDCANPQLFKNFLFWARDNFWQKKEPKEDFKDICGRFYLEKTISRAQIHLAGRIDEDQIINGIKVPRFNDLIKNIDKDWISDGIPVRFHGDFILDNILVKKDGSFVLIDWRQDFNGILDYGDLYYDISKMNHNLTVNHEIVNKKLYKNKEVNQNEKICDIMCSARLMECKKILMGFARDMGLDVKKVEVLTALIWINMSGVHDDEFGKFLFNWGKYNLSLSLCSESKFQI